jgi:nucleoside-diphosphate-sugar epimerase
MAKLIFGCGYLGSRVARLWQAQGEEVFVVTRSEERVRLFKALGLHPIVADVLQPKSLARLPQADSVLFAVGHDRGSGASLHEVYVGGLRNVLASLADSMRRFIYVSSTGVYGQSHGETVDESSPAEPNREGGRASLAAERALAADRLGERGIVLRMAGLYGPGRIPLADKIRRGEPIPAAAESTLNLIHIDDAARVVLAAEAHAKPPRTYVISDGHPALRRDYYEELARLLNAPPPAFAPPDPSAARTGRSAGDKRIDNTRMKRELGGQLLYPSFREGLAAIVAEEK